MFDIFRYFFILFIYFISDTCVFIQETVRKFLATYCKNSITEFDLNSTDDCFFIFHIILVSIYYNY